MIWEWRRKTTVKPGGKVEVLLPELSDGQTVEVVIRGETKAGSNGKRTGFGSASGRIKVGDDFDAPISDFDDYK
ncbi:MAG: DUF2281 domain-containing protein [Planctomycetes bacterium]|nr:DUF2281 domain-containing protein [Planctomycetota bacterium]MBI3834655.1 DUF2281 domain-containing protein [Planctomycetota bacterium]